jgi:RHS repeat-associated protein
MKTMHNYCISISLVIGLMVSIFSANGQTPTTTKNYIMEKTVLVKDLKTKSQLTGQSVSNVNTQVTYFDGLGRPVQQVGYQSTQSKKDFVQHIQYDEHGRVKYSYLPYGTGTTGTAAFRAAAGSEQVTFYNNLFGGNAGNYAFGENEYDGSPLNRVTTSYAPGSPWSKTSGGGGKPVKMDYQLNGSDDKVIHWEILDGQLISKQFYGAEKLYKLISTDEDNHQVIEFKDKQGRILLKRVQAPNGKWANTYQVFDKYGNLIYVLPPEASNEYDNADLIMPVGYYLVKDDQIYSSISGISGGKVAYLPTGSVTVTPGTTLGNGVHIKPHGIMPVQSFLNQWAFQYKYDDRQRLIEKVVPGTKSMYLVYDKLDRVVLTQDGNQRLSNKWTFVKYDQLNRPVIVGEKVITGTIANIRSAVENSTVLFETYNGSGVGKYTNLAYPTGITEAEILSLTYFDNYNFTTRTYSLPSQLNNSSDGKIIPAVFATVRGKVTGTKVKVLGTASDYIESVNFYDNRYRLIQSKVVNYKGGEDIISIQYDFAGRERKTHLGHSNPAADIGATNITQEYTYDHVGRLLTINHSINGDPSVTLVSNTYNELGELINKDLADSYEDINYAYNIRGWLSKINNLSDATEKLFEMDLEYNNAPTGHKVYNGNIGATAWKNPYEAMVNRYDYEYDEMDRLKAADYSNGGASTMSFDVPLISYDLNGNILTLQRKGTDENDNVNVTIDNLSYTYASGNQLSKVTDSSGKTAGFKDGTNQTVEYTYDDNGNMKEDRNKGITSIEYNVLNLPKKVTYNASKYIEYTYDASGAKRSQKVVEGGTTTISDFVAGFVYENNKLQFMQHNEGRVVAKRTETGTFDGFQYQYHIKDHLGNVRVTFKTDQASSGRYTATFEDDAETKDYESVYFSRYGEVTRINADIFDHTDAGNSKSYSMRLNGTPNEVYGLGKSLAVNPGDVVDAEVWAKYLDPATKGKTGSAFAQLVEDLSNNVSSVIVDGAKAATSPTMPFAGLIDHGSEASEAPKAYLNMLVFDREYKLINSSFKQIGKQAAEDGSDISHQYLNVGPMTMTEPGYVYIYLSNENGTPVEVFFDDFSVYLTGTDVVQKDDYYPFGGSFNAYTDLSTPQQEYLYNGVKLNKTTQLYETAFRTYDPYLGRFNHVDPLAAIVPGLSPYHFGFNNPVRYNDPLGLMGDDAGIWGTGNAYASRASKNPLGGFTGPGSGHHWSDQYRDPYHNWMSMGSSTFNGFYGLDPSSGTYNEDFLSLVGSSCNCATSGSFKWIDHPSTVSGNIYDGSLTVSAKASELVFVEQNGQNGGGNWATAALAFMAVDMTVPDPTDAAWPKWAGYAVLGTAAAVYLANNNSNNNFFYVTYTKTNATGQVYVGRSSGYGDPYSVVRARDSNHHMTGYGPAVLSSSARAMVPGGFSTRAVDPSYWYIRGSEQVQIEYYRSRGISGNGYNGIGPNNPNIWKYLDSFTKYKF